VKDYYQILGVAETAKPEEIKKSYRRLAKQHHPDATGGDKKREARFKEIAEAYEVLSDEKKRAEYDARRRFGGGGGPFGGAQPGGPGGINLDDLFSQFGGPGGGGYQVHVDEGGPDLGSMFGDIFGGGRRRGRRTPTKGVDREAEATIDFHTAALGGTTILATPEGRRTVRIPGGAVQGDRIRLPGLGEPGPAGPGDLVISIHVGPDPHLAREGDDVVVDLPLTIDEAVAGARVEVPTLDGPATLTVPPGTSSGTRLRLRGKGAARKKTRGERGDQFAVARIVVPPNPDARVRELAVELGKAAPLRPRSY
jgi:DnaJ-class molecular chaperone